jgi:hypothetical protein
MNIIHSLNCNNLTLCHIVNNSITHSKNDTDARKTSKMYECNDKLIDEIISTTKYLYMIQNKRDCYEKIVNLSNDKILTKGKKIRNEELKRIQIALNLSKKDIDYFNSDNIVYIVNPNHKNIPNDLKEYFEKMKASNISINMDIFENGSIDKKKQKYEGPKWISNVKCNENVNNKLIFVDIDRDIVHIYTIIHITPFSRYHKNISWKEKEHKDRNILFLKENKIMTAKKFTKITKIDIKKREHYKLYVDDNSFID